MSEWLSNLDFSVIWLILVIGLLVLESSTVNLVAIWFALGSLCALFSAVLGADFWLQIVIFTIVSFVSLLFTRPLVKKLTNPINTKTNSDAIIGATAIVSIKIDNLSGEGYVSVNGVEWMARSKNDETIEINEKVTILSIEGVKVIVEKII